MIDIKNLPTKAKFTKLKDVCTYSKGKKPKLLAKEKTGKFVLPYINIKAFEKGVFDEYTDGEKCNLCEDGDLLMVWDGARAGFTGKAKKGAIGSTLMKIEPRVGLNKEYLFYFLLSQYRKLNTNPRGVGIPHVEPSLLWNAEFLFPDLNIQQTIVSKIEELFSELDKGIAELKLAQEQLKVYRQSVLKYAFEGRLTNNNVKDGELPQGWEWKKLGGHIVNISSGKSYRCEERPPNKDEVGIVKVSSVTRGVFDQFESKTCFSNEFYNPKYLIQKEDFLFSRANTIEFIGACAIVWKIDKQLMLSDKILRFTFSNDLSKKYALYFLQSRIGRKQIESLSTGNQDSMRNIGQEKIKQILIPFCSPDIQKQVVEEIESRLGVVEQLDVNIKNSLQKAEALRQSILKKAFNGELVKEVKAIEVPKIKNEYFHQLQLVALVINGFKKQKIDHGEMTLAKNLYLLDSIYKIPTGFKYDRWHLGPYPPALKKVVNNKEYFKRNELFIEATNDDKLLKYSNPYQDEVNTAINDLSAIFSKYKGAERSHKTELLATVCKVIEDVKSTDLAAVRQSMAEWKIDLKTSKFKNKAEKFDEPETKKCVEFIKEKGWDRKLISML